MSFHNVLSLVTIISIVDHCLADCPPRSLDASLVHTNKVGAHLEALDEGVLMVPLNPRYTQVGLNSVFVQV